MKAAETRNGTWWRETKRTDSLSWLSSISPATATAATLMSQRDLNTSATVQHTPFIIPFLLDYVLQQEKKKSKIRICNSTVEVQLMATHTPCNLMSCGCREQRAAAVVPSLSSLCWEKECTAIHMTRGRANLTWTRRAALICVFEDELLMCILVTNNKIMVYCIMWNMYRHGNKTSTKV